MYYSNRNAKLMLSKQRYSLEVKKEEPPKSVEAQIGEGLELKQLLRKTIQELNKARDDPVEELRQIIKPQLPTRSYLPDKPVKIRTDGSRLSRKGNGLFKHPLKGRNQSVVKMVNKYSDKQVKSLKVCRTPVIGGIQKALNFLSNNKFDFITKKMKYSDIWHLFIYVYFTDGSHLRLDKNEVVTVTENAPGTHGECVEIKLNNKAIFGRIWTRMEESNPNLYHYVAWKYNCQNFVDTFLRSSGVKSRNIYKFVNQSYEKAFSPALKLFTQGITDVGAMFSRMMGKGLELPSGGDGLKLAGKQNDPLEKLRGKISISGQGLNLPTGGNGMKPDKKVLNRVLKGHLMDELKQNHPHLDLKHMKKIVTNFKLHKDELTLPEHGKHLAGQLIKHYFPTESRLAKSKGHKGNGLFDGLKEKVGKVIFNAIKYYLESGRKQAGSGKKLKQLGNFFKKAGKFLLDHRKEIAKGVKKAADVGAVIATAVGQPELAAPLKTVATIAGAVEKI